MRKLLCLLIITQFLSCSKDYRCKIPCGLMTEFIREPEGVKILDLKPEFTWIVPRDAGIQTAFQILVASSEVSIENNSGDVWNSGKVMSSRSSEVEYGGNILSANKKYYWKVRIWDEKNRPTKYSKTISFITGDPGGYSTSANRFVTDIQKPEKLIRMDRGHYFADFGRDAFGTIIIDLSPAHIDTILVHLGEKIDSVNSIDRHSVGSVRYQKFSLTLNPGKNIYILELPPDIRNTGPAAVHLPDSFGIITPFRYCEIENIDTDLKPENILRKAYHYYFNDETSSFTSSDTILNQVWNICKYTMKATSFTGIYIDGDRERIPYEGDAYINQLGHYYTDREYTMARITNEYFIEHPTWPTEWILHTLLMFYNDFMFTGNLESVKAYYEALKHKTLISLTGEDGLISTKNVSDEIMKMLGFANTKGRIRDIVDWPPAQKDTGWKLATSEGERDGYDMVEINTVVNAFYYRNLILMSEIAGVLGEKGDSIYFHNASDKTRYSFNKKLLDNNKGYYIDGVNSVHSSLHANMMALAFGLVPESCLESVIKFIKSRGMACSVYGSQYLLEGLYRAGEEDYAFKLLTATHDRSWWNMIRSGSTITMEAWDMKYKPNSDWNHAWGAAPANIIPAYMWGIKPAEPGFAKAVIRPQLSSLKSCRIMVPTIRGPIIGEFKNSGISKEYQITIPGNMECDFVIPKFQGKPIKLNKKKIVPANEIIRLHSGLNKIIL